MTGGSLAPRTGSYGSLQLPSIFNNNNNGKSITRKTSAKMLFSGPREKERFLPFVCCLFLGRRRVAMLLLVVLALLVFTFGSLIVNKENTTPNVDQHIGNLDPFSNQGDNSPALIIPGVEDTLKDGNSSLKNDERRSDENRVQHPPPSHHPCENFAFPPPPPPGFRRPGPRRSVKAHAFMCLLPDSLCDLRRELRESEVHQVESTFSFWQVNIFSDFLTKLRRRSSTSRHT
ncbi:hypothetical protein JRO89_XS15G0115300 [Xanthoceras sorbifolium]|uniref:Uncharacterized protein n=1 Tax=Xanthoceras sorbifolium TaxID=99658 RepID=A0ABQ8H1R2_9ROSI|nr:hypothetical protein JRO89_XS15G0115300 [Xanthoceras sorbifolium]